MTIAGLQGGIGRNGGRRVRKGILMAAIWAAAVLAESPWSDEGGNPWHIAELQILLARCGFSCGLVDNRVGPKTRAAWVDYLRSRGFNETVPALSELRRDSRSLWFSHLLKSEDFESIGPVFEKWEEAARQPAMPYASLLESLADRYGASERFLQERNPALVWQTLGPGDRVWVPQRGPVQLKAPLTRLEIDTASFRLRGYATNEQLVLSMPCSIARRSEKVPAGDLFVANLADRPTYTFNPALFPDHPRAREIGRVLILPPGPNNPVGLYWIGLSRAGYGIHGTPHPDTVGSRESGGCFRLTNYDVRELSRHVRIGMPVTVREPPDRQGENR